MSGSPLAGSHGCYNRAVTSLPHDQNFTLHCDAMKAIKSLNDQDFLVYDGTRLNWNGDLGLLRSFVENIVGLVGAWKSTGGKSKQFTNSNSDIIVAWYPGKLNSLTFNGENGESFKKALVRILRDDGAEKSTLSSDCLCKTIVDSPVDAVAPKDLGCICQNLNVNMNNKVAKSPIVIDDNVSGSVKDILMRDCSSLEELKNFIDRSFKGVGCLLLKNDNIFLAQSIDSSTPSRSSFDIKSGTLEDRSTILKAEMESGFLYLKAALSEQTKIINACKQDICQLSNENLILKLPLSEIEEKCKVPVNKSIPCCEEKSQMTAPIEDNDDNALTYCIDEHRTIVGSQDHNNKSNCESFRVINYVEKPPSGKEVPPLTKKNGVQEEKNPRSGLDNKAIGPLNNENIALKSQLLNDKAYRKSLTPCLFLMRRG